MPEMEVGKVTSIADVGIDIGKIDDLVFIKVFIKFFTIVFTIVFILFFFSF